MAVCLFVCLFYDVGWDAEAVAVPAGALEEGDKMLEHDGAVDGLCEVDVAHVAGAQLVDKAACLARGRLVDWPHGRVVHTSHDRHPHLVERGCLGDPLDAVGAGVFLCEEAERSATDLVPYGWVDGHCDVMCLC